MSNVIWRITVGQQVDDTQVNDIVAAVTSVFSVLTSNIPINLLQKNSVWVTKLLKWMGRPNFLDSWKSLWSISAKMVEPFGPDPQGNYFEQGLDYCQKATENKFMNPTSGHLYMEASAMIFFLAGDIW